MAIILSLEIVASCVVGKSDILITYNQRCTSTVRQVDAKVLIPFGMCSILTPILQSSWGHLPSLPTSGTPSFCSPQPLSHWVTQIAHWFPKCRRELPHDRFWLCFAPRGLALRKMPERRSAGLSGHLRRIGAIPLRRLHVWWRQTAQYF